MNEVTEILNYSSQPHSSQLLWFRDIWRDLLGPRRDRCWVIVVLKDGDFFLRDGLAYAWLYDSLRGRTDVTWRFVRAFMIDDRQLPLRPGEDLIILGRGRPIAGTALGPCVTILEGPAAGKFLDPKTGESADTIKYGDRRYTRRFLEEPPFSPFRRCDRDYGVFMLRQHGSGADQRTIVSIGGLGSLGTLILMFLLHDESFRRELARAINKLVKWTVHHRPEQQFEICVRVEVDGEERLSRLLDALSRGERDAFDYRLEVVAVGTEGGKPDLFYRDEDHSDLELRIDSDGGSLRAAGKTTWVRIAPLRFAVLRALVEDPQHSTPADLCRRLNFIPADRAEPDGRQRNNLSRIIHDLNADLRSENLLGRRFTRAVRHCKKDGRYLLDGIQVTVLQSRMESGHTRANLDRSGGGLMW
jgi:hypothetical protein